jgi:hypothetical protein
VTPHGSPSQGLYLTRPPSSLESLLLGPAHRNPAADHSAQSHNHNAHGHGYHAHRYSDKSYDTHIPKPPQTALGGGALCALLGARMWLPASEMCSIVERPGCAFAGREFLARLEAEIEQFGPEMWRFSGMPGREFLRARINVDGDAIT